MPSKSHVIAFTYSLSGNTYKTKIMPFWPLCCKSEAILSTKFRPGYPDWSVNMGTFSSRLPRSRSEKPSNRASPASHMNPSTFLRRKKWRGEISETEPAWLTGLIWRGPRTKRLLLWQMPIVSIFRSRTTWLESIDRGEILRPRN